MTIATVCISFVLTTAILVGGLAWFEVRHGRERAALLDRIQAPEAQAARAWTQAAATAPTVPSDADIDREFAALDASLIPVPDDLQPLFFNEE